MKSRRRYFWVSPAAFCHGVFCIAGFRDAYTVSKMKLLFIDIIPLHRLLAVPLPFQGRHCAQNLSFAKYDHFQPPLKGEGTIAQQWWRGSHVIRASLKTPNPSDVVQICDRFPCGKMQEYSMYFKFFRKGRWRKDAPQMTGERVFRGDHL